MNIDRQLDARQSRRMAAERRFLERMERRESQASQMIGELNDGRCYVYPVGGAYREGTREELISYLIHNNYA